MQLIVAEKPSVGRDLARVLGVRSAGRGAIAGKEHVISWCIGHLVELDEPASYDPRWKAWRLDTLPMLPGAFKLRAVQSTRDQLETVSALLRETRFTEVVNACDAGREGELIFRYLYDLAGCRLPIRRLWISSMTDEAIRGGFAALKPGTQYDPLADAARCRSEADWLVGMNATRAVTVSRRGAGQSTLYSIGRVQTPTLAIVVQREQAISAFVPRDYWETRAKLSTLDGTTFSALWTQGKITRFGQRALADGVVARDNAHGRADHLTGPVVSRLQQKKTREPPPFLFDLTSLQRTANRRFGLSATRTLEAAQALYERHKLLTYPRTDARHLSQDMFAELPKLFSGLAQFPAYAPFAAPLCQTPPAANKRVFDDTKVSDHHAIIPTGKVVNPDSLERDEQRIFDLVVLRFLGAFFPDAEFASTEATITVGATADAAQTAAAKNQTAATPRAGRGAKSPVPGAAPGAPEDETLLEILPPLPDHYIARGRVRLAAGWQAVAGIGAHAEDADIVATLPILQIGQRLAGTFDAVAKQTKPPPRHTEATLLGAMENAGRTIDDDQLRAAMKDTGLGTPATRAATIETLLKRTFILRDGKHIVATEMGMALIAALPVASLASPELTGSWEARLARIARGQDSRTSFMKDIAAYVTDMVQTIRGKPAAGVAGKAPPVPQKVAPTTPSAAAPPALTCPQCKTGLLMAGKRGWGCDRWREGCAFVVWFEIAGNRLTEGQLRELVSKGKTRKLKWPRAGATPLTGRLVLDLAGLRGQGAARFDVEPAAD